MPCRASNTTLCPSGAEFASKFHKRRFGKFAASRPGVRLCSSAHVNSLKQCLVESPPVEFGDLGNRKRKAHGLKLNERYDFERSVHFALCRNIYAGRRRAES